MICRSQAFQQKGLLFNSDSLPTSILAYRRRDSFLQGCLPIQHHGKGYGSALRQRHADEKTSAIRCDLAANKARR